MLAEQRRVVQREGVRFGGLYFTAAELTDRRGVKKRGAASAFSPPEACGGGVGWRWRQRQQLRGHHHHPQQRQAHAQSLEEPGHGAGRVQGHQRPGRQRHRTILLTTL